AFLLHALSAFPDRCSLPLRRSRLSRRSYLSRAVILLGRQSLIGKLPADLSEGVERLFERPVHGRIEVGPDLLFHDAQNFLFWERRLVGPHRMQRVIHISDRDDARFKRNRFSRQSLRVAGPVPPLVMRQSNRGRHDKEGVPSVGIRIRRFDHRSRAKWYGSLYVLLEDAGPDSTMPLHDLPFLRRQFARL